MVVIRLNALQFEYDILSLVKAFYPEREVKIMQADACILFLKEYDKECDGEGIIPMEVYYGIESIGVRLYEQCCSLEQQEVLTSEAKQERIFQIQEGEVRLTIKNKLKKAIYDILHMETGSTLPWGTLTGIRPTKIPMAMIEAGQSEASIIQSMADTYYMSGEKATLCIEITKREREIFSRIHQENGYSLYIGIPFCPTTCLYCSFTSYPRKRFEEQIGAYLEALYTELAYVRETFDGKILDTIYIGGGTPTTLTDKELDELLAYITSTFHMETVQEFTVEAGRADSITREKLQVLKGYGVTRISINPQTMKEETLQLIGRNHTIEQVREAYEIAREEGFSNINMDLILGLPDETKEDVSRTIEEIVSLNPDSITVHSLAIKRASALSDWMEANGIEQLQNTQELMSLAELGAKKMNMKPYYLYRQKNMAGNLENIGYARDGKYGIYNSIIMEEKQSIVAVGAGSISKVITREGAIKRCDCVKDVGMYIDEIEAMIQRKRELFSLL